MNGPTLILIPWLMIVSAIPISKAKNEEPCSFFIDQSLFPATKRCLHIGRDYLDLAPQVILLCPSWWWGSSLIVQHIDVLDKAPRLSISNVIWILSSDTIC